LPGAIIGVQTHAPMRGGIGDGIVFGFRERVFGHWLILISCILTFGASLREHQSWHLTINV
jgi:hypothetical protein